MQKTLLDKRIKAFMHVVFWAFMFLSPMQYMRGTGMSLLHYAMNCMPSLLLMLVFYANYMWLTPRYFVAGKHRYFLMFNTLIIVTLVVFQHYWMDFTNDVFRSPREPDTLDTFLFVIRDTVNFIIFATAATCIKLAQQWMWADKARKDAETARAMAELSNLRNQINPHFLLNTLNNIYALTSFDTAKAQEAIQELSKMLRHILYDYQQPTVPLKDEVEFLENYVNLMRIRLPQTVDIQFSHSIRAAQIDIAPMIFISLVENAFKHGVSPVEPSFIHINIDADEQQISCDIVNSNHPKAANDHSGHGIGLQQVQRRLELAYFNHHTWEKGVYANGKEYRAHIQITDWKESNSKLRNEE